MSLQLLHLQFHNFQNLLLSFDRLLVQSLQTSTWLNSVPSTLKQSLHHFASFWIVCNSNSQIFFHQFFFSKQVSLGQARLGQVLTSKQFVWFQICLLHHQFSDNSGQTLWLSEKINVNDEVFLEEMEGTYIPDTIKKSPVLYSQLMYIFQFSKRDNNENTAK